MGEDQKHLEYAGVGVKSGKQDSTASVSLAFALVFVGVILVSAGTCGYPETPREFWVFVWPVSAMAAVVFGAGYVWAKRRREEGRPLWWAGKVGCLGMGVLVILVMGVFVGGVSQAIGRAQRVSCASNLRQIGQGILLYANSNEGKFPGRLEQLIADADLNAYVFVCPSSSDEAAEAPTTQAVVAELGKEGHCSYVYLGAGMATGVAANVVVAHEKPGNHDGMGMNVLFGDGAVAWVSAGQMKSVLADLKAGVNPPRVFAGAGGGK